MLGLSCTTSFKADDPVCSSGRGHVYKSLVGGFSTISIHRQDNISIVYGFN